MKPENEVRTREVSPDVTKDAGQDSEEKRFSEEAKDSAMLELKLLPLSIASHNELPSLELPYTQFNRKLNLNIHHSRFTSESPQNVIKHSPIVMKTPNKAMSKFVSPRHYSYAKNVKYPVSPTHKMTINDLDS